MDEIWNKCCCELEKIMPSQQFSLWIRPLHLERDVNGSVIVYAPNRFVSDWVKDRYYDSIKSHLLKLIPDLKDLLFEVESSCSANQLDLNSNYQSDSCASDSGLIADGMENYNKNEFIIDNTSIKSVNIDEDFQPIQQKKNTSIKQSVSDNKDQKVFLQNNMLNKSYLFEDFVEGKSNQLARAAAIQVAANPGISYNPLVIYGDTGLGKTHLLQAIGNQILQNNPNTKVLYTHSEEFVQNMVMAIQKNHISYFKKMYRSADVLLIDDIQFFANKDRSQEEFFHTFNTLLGCNNQVVLSSDRYPKDINGVADRLKSRFGSGLTVSVEVPELETRVAILIKKAQLQGISLPHEVAFFIAKHLCSNIRELEGALNKLLVNYNFINSSEIDINFTKQALRDLFVSQEKTITVDLIQKSVSDYYHLKVSDLLSKFRNRSFSRPRQIAMALCKDLTKSSLPEIGYCFNGRDHTTVLYACKKVKQLCIENPVIKEEYDSLVKIILS